jgi:hypothetical protein
MEGETMTKGGTRGKQIPPVKTEDLEHDKFNTIYESLTDDLVVLTVLEKIWRTVNKMIIQLGDIR